VHSGIPADVERKSRINRAVGSRRIRQEAATLLEARRRPRQGFNQQRCSYYQLATTPGAAEMTNETKAASYHARVMNIRDDATDEMFPGSSRFAYKTGHKDARHVAAEIASEADAEIERLREDRDAFRASSDIRGAEVERLTARVAELLGCLVRVHNCIESQHLPHPLRVAVADAVARDVTLSTVQSERDELRARVAELEALRDAAFEMSRCECDSDEACANLVALHRKVAELETEKENFDHAKSYIVDLEAKIVELEAARGEPVAYLHQVVCGDGEPDQALSFEPDNFPLSNVLGYRSLSHVPLYTTPSAPAVDVDAISEEAILRTQRAVWAECGRDVNAKLIRTVVDAIFNKGE
jgi:hypothetical protein